MSSLDLGCIVVDPEAVIERVCRRLGVSRDEFFNTRIRRQNVVEARRRACKLLRRHGPRGEKVTVMPLLKIEAAIGMEHTSVIAAIKAPPRFRWNQKLYRKLLAAPLNGTIDLDQQRHQRRRAREWQRKGWLWV